MLRLAKDQKYGFTELYHPIALPVDTGTADEVLRVSVQLVHVQISTQRAWTGTGWYW